LAVNFRFASRLLAAWFAVAVTVSPLPAARAQQQTAINRQALEKALESPSEPSAEVAALIAKLGDESWSVRESASAKLRRLGVEVLPALKYAYHRTTDAEVRLRIEQVFQGIVTPRALRESLQIALLGIRIAASAADSQEPIRIEKIIEGGAASKAGLQDQDEIIALNGKAIDLSNGSNGFRFPLWACGKGAVVTLKILRDGKELEVQATLEGGDTSQLLPEDLEAFEQWYWKHWFETHVKTDKSSKRSSLR
jgi:C-terminal processing protease CtpA/Prc